MPSTSSTRDRKPKVNVRSARTQKVNVDAWAEKLMHMILGATMTQVAICRFLIRETRIDRQRLLMFFEECGMKWSKTSSDEALLPLITILTRVKLADEPDFPIASSKAKARPLWPTFHRRTYGQRKRARKMSKRPAPLTRRG